MAEAAEATAKASPAPRHTDRNTNLWETFRHELNQVFDRFTGKIPISPARDDDSLGMCMPVLDFAEDDKEYRLTAELPGMNEKDVDLEISGDMLVLTGEKKRHQKHKDANYFVSERSYGWFHRSIPLPQAADREKIEASFRDGVLTVRMPKSATALQQKKKIEIAAS